MNFFCATGGDLQYSAPVLYCQWTGFMRGIKDILVAVGQIEAIVMCYCPRIEPLLSPLFQCIHIPTSPETQGLASAQILQHLVLLIWNFLLRSGKKFLFTFAICLMLVYWMYITRVGSEGGDSIAPQNSTIPTINKINNTAVITCSPNWCPLLRLRLDSNKMNRYKNGDNKYWNWFSKKAILFIPFTNRTIFTCVYIAPYVYIVRARLFFFLHSWSKPETAS